MLYRFAVLIIPTYVDPRDAQSNPFRSTSTLAIDSDPELRGDDDGEHLQGEGERKNSWRWFHTVNRVCSGVKKVRLPSFFPHSLSPLLSTPVRKSDPHAVPGLQTLVLLYVVIPPLSSLPPEPDWVARHPAQALAKLEMREVVVRRFLAGRMRD
jgi:tRNA-splicing endonuclease subunit Sen2